MSRHNIKRETHLLIDTRPLLAFIDKPDPWHQQVIDLLRRLPSITLLTTWPCVTEAMYLLERVGGHPLQAALWGFC